MHRPTVTRLPHATSTSAEDIAAMLDSDGWMAFLHLVVGKTLAAERTALATRARSAMEPELALLAVARSQARIDALTKLVFDAYDEADVQEQDWPIGVKVALNSPGALK